VVEVDKLTHWIYTDVPEYNVEVEDEDNMRQSPFIWDDHLNRKIILWCGDITQLNTEAIVNSTNESLSDRNPLSERIFLKAGAQLKLEIKNEIKTCKTGEARMTKGYNLPSRHIIHTVGPRYNVRYKTAAESALYNCYRNVMQIVRDSHIPSVALPCIHSSRRGYPSYEGAHIAIRTVRRFMDRFGDDIESVTFVVTGDDEEVYTSLLPLYFPRSRSEEIFAAYHLPYDVGNETGEPVIAERQIRIDPKPAKAFVRGMMTDRPSMFEETVNINEVFETSMPVGAHPFAKMEVDIDKKRRQQIQGKIVAEANILEQQRRYERWLKRAKADDLSSVSQLRCLYQSGFDRYNRPVLVFISKFFKQYMVDPDKAAMYLIREMDNIVSKEYVVVYVHTAADKDNQPETSFIKDIINLIDARYRNNLRAFYILHPTFWFKFGTWFLTTFQISGLKDKVHNIPGLEYLYSRIPADQLDLPQFVHDYDLRFNGTRYYRPEEDQAIGAL